MLTKISRKKQTIWRAAFMYFDNVVAVLNGIVIVPLYLKYIDLGLYGAWLATGNILIWLTMIDPGIGDVLTQKISASYAINNRREIGMQLGSSILLSFAVSIIVMFIGLGLIPFLENILNPATSIDIAILKKAFLYGTIGTATTLFGYFLAGAIVGLQNAKAQGFVRSIWGLLSFLIKIFLLIYGFGLLAIPYSALIGSIIYLILSSVLLLRIIRKERIKFVFSYSHLVSFSNVFLYTFSSKMMSTIKNNIDLILIARFLKPEMVVAFDLTRRPIKLLYSFFSRPAAALVASFANLRGEENFKVLKNVTGKVVSLSVLGLVFIASGIIAFNEDLISLWIGKDFFLGQKFNIALSIFFMISTFSYILSNLTYSLGNIKGNSQIEIIRDSISLLTLLTFAYYFGMWGIIIAPFVGVVFVDMIYFPKKLIKLIRMNNNILQFLDKSFIFIIPIGFLLSIIFYYIIVKNWGQLILSTVFFVSIYFLISFLFSQSFRHNIISIIKKVD